MAEDTSAEGILAAKLISMVVLSLATFILGFIPIFMSRCFKWNQQPDTSRLVLSLLLSFGGGALLCTTFMHLLPEVDDAVTSLQHDGVIQETSFPLTHLIMCCGFFFMYFVEELVHLYLHSRRKPEEIERVLHRSMSVRRCSTESRGSNSTLETRDVCDEFCHEGHSHDDNSHSHDDQSQKSHSHDNNSQKSHSHDDHSHQDPSHDGQSQKSHSHDGHSHQDHSHDGHSHQDHSHDGHSHQDHSHDGHSHQDHSHAGHSHQDHHGHSHQANGHSHQATSCNQKGHSHVVMPLSDPTDVVTSLRGLLIVVALSVHELFEGLALGLETTTSGTYYMLGAVASHKLVLAFCVGLELVSARTPMCLNVVYMATFAVVSPVGIGIGIGLSAANSEGEGVVNVVLQGVACGTLLYVVFFEVLTRERVNSNTNGLLQLLAILVGFGTMFGLLLATSDGHSHEEEEEEVTSKIFTALSMSTTAF